MAIKRTEVQGNWEWGLFVQRSEHFNDFAEHPQEKNGENFQYKFAKIKRRVGILTCTQMT